MSNQVQVWIKILWLYNGVLLNEVNVKDGDKVEF
jgi:hypothetical protein